MAWSKTKQQLESFLCESLKKRVEYRATAYRYSPDKSGKCYITVDKKEVFDMNEQKAIDKKIDLQLKHIKDEIHERKHYIPVPTQKGRELYEMASRRPDNVNDGSQITVNEDKCIGCGMCTLVCPIGNFYLQDKKAKRKSNQCEFCLACAHHCPRKAIYTSLSDKNPEARFINENIKISEIIKANQQ